MPKRKVISGHGRFEKKNLEDNPKKKRAKLAKFSIPANVNITVYAPDGAKLENQVANRIETNSHIDNSMLEMKATDGGPKKELDKEYPKTLKGSEGAEMVNYTVKPPSGLNVQGNKDEVITVPDSEPKGKSLKKIVDEEVKKEKPEAGKELDLHFACCCAGFDEGKDEKLFEEGKGYHVQLKKGK